MVLRKRHQFAEIAGQLFARGAQFGHHGSEQHGGAKRLQRILRPYQQRRRRAPSRALQGRQHLDDLGAARIERAADLLLAGIERAQPRFGVADPGLYAAHLGGDVDQLRLSLLRSWPIAAMSALSFLLQFRGVFLLRAGGFEFLLALLDGVG